MLNTLRTWPYFKFYPNDWMTSTTVCCFSHAQQGAYLALLCNAWTEENCTIPAESVQLKHLIRWQGTDKDFTAILACFPLTRNGKRRYNPRLHAERQEAMGYRIKQSEGGKRGMQIRWKKKARTRAHGKPTRPRPLLTTDLLANDLAVNPLYTHINLPRELAKAQQWITDHPPRQFTKSFVVNWLNKIDPPMDNGHGGALTCPHCPHLTFPDPKAKRGHDQIYHPKFEG